MSDDPQTPTRTLLPIHAAAIDASTGKVLRVHRRPGRPRRAKPAPDCSELEYIEAVNVARDEHVARDGLVRTLAEGAPADRVLQEIVKGIARESASVAFEIRKAKQQDRDIEVLLARRVDGLAKIAALLLSQRRVGIEPEIAPEKLEQISQLWIEMIRDAAEVLPAEVAGPFVAKVEKAMSEWLEGRDR